MKRPDIITIFSPVPISPAATAERVLNLFLDDLHGSLGGYYAKLEYDVEERSYEISEEHLDLAGREDLLAKVEKERNLMWRCHVDLGFANAYVYPAVFVDPEHKPETTLLLRIDPSITRFVETAEEVRAPFAIFLARVAMAVGSDWFLGGLHLDTWRPLEASQLMHRSQIGPSPILGGWKTGAFDDHAIATGLNVSLEDIKRTTRSYSFVFFLPPA